MTLTICLYIFGSLSIFKQTPELAVLPEPIKLVFAEKYLSKSSGQLLCNSDLPLDDTFERIITANEDHCRKIMETYQEILNMGAAKFKWNDKSLLTGDTIPGSDLCIDWQCAGKDLRDSTKEEEDALRMSVIQEEDSEPCGGQNVESTGKYEYCHRPRSAIERRREHYANETCLQVELPSYAGFDESVNSIVNEAEKLIRGVNDWLSVKEHRRE